MKELQAIVGVSNRHVHLSAADRDILFGKNAPLEFRKPLRQPGQYAAEQVVTLAGPKGRIDRVRVLCPLRTQSQVELSRTDTFTLGIEPCFRQSGDLSGSPGICIIGPKGCVQLSEGAIVALRHLHLDPLTAEEYGLNDQQMVSARTDGARAVIFAKILVRVSELFVPEFHVDTDEANGADLVTGDQVHIF